MADILVIHGPNLNLLGKREPQLYGKESLKDIEKRLSEKISSRYSIDFFQSNHEGEIISHIGEMGWEARGILINPAAYTHSSVGIRDALLAVDKPFVEIHMSNIFSREKFRQKSFLSDCAKAVISGCGSYSYDYGLLHLIKILSHE